MIWERLQNLDRRWIFLLTGVVIAVPIIIGFEFPERPSKFSQSAFDQLEKIPKGSTVLFALDYDFSSQGELTPMTRALVHHACQRKLKMCFLTLWPLGPPQIQLASDLIREHYPEMVYGTDYLDLGYKPGEIAVIQGVLKSMEQIFPVDSSGKPLNSWPIMKPITKVADFEMILSVSAGDPGSKEWISIAATPQDIVVISGSTGVQSPAIIPYYPKPMVGLLNAIKGAAEYESLVSQHYPEVKKDSKSTLAMRRMAPQAFAHVFIMLMIILGNLTHLALKKRQGGAR